LVYDCTNKQSYDNLKNWYVEICDKGPKDVILAVVGNKADLKEAKQIAEDEGREFATDRRAIFAEVSAKENHGVVELFNRLSDELIKKLHILEDEIDTSRQRLNTKKQNKGGCC
jgi:GTPase SAR1 family protein